MSQIATQTPWRTNFPRVDRVDRQRRQFEQERNQWDTNKKREQQGTRDERIGSIR